MLPFVNLPVKIVKMFTSNVADSEIAAGVCLALFMGFIPLNGPMAVLLVLLFFVFKINRLATMLVLPVFKLIYALGAVHLADMIGGLLLLKADMLKGFWRVITTMPVLAYLELNNTLVAGGLVIAAVLSYPVYIASRKGIVILRERYFQRIRNSRIVKWFMKIPLVGRITRFISRVK